MTTARPHYLPIPYQDSTETGRLILRDGSSAIIQVAGPQHKEALASFFAGLPEKSRFLRFFTVSEPSDVLIESFCDDSDPRKRLTLVVRRSVEDNFTIIAAGSYMGLDASTAEVAMAVHDRFQGKGIGTILLERLALLAVMNGFRSFRAVTMVENKAMLDVFRNSGFHCRTKMDGAYVEVDLSVAATEASVSRAELRDRIATAASLRSFFQPASVTVIGASRNPASIGGRILSALVDAGFRGPIYPVNPNAAKIAALTAYPSIDQVPQLVDLAIVAVPRDAVLVTIDACAARSVRAVVLITAGFAETGPRGAELQSAVVEKIRGYGMRLVGPNCLGLMNTDPAVRLNASFSPIFPAPGHIAFSSQSGALGLAVLSLTRERQLGISNFISVGNKADVSGNDLLQYWEEDKQTHVILLYLESFGNPRRFGRIAKRVSRRKPIVAVKAGRTAAGTRAAGSHTAALAGSDIAVESLFHQTGVIRAETLEELFDVAAALSSQPLPRGRRVAILTNAGGLGILCADSCEANGLHVPELQPGTRHLLQQFLPAAASVGNPVDLVASATSDHFRKAIETILPASEIDALIVLYIDVGIEQPSSLVERIGVGVAGARRLGGAEKPVLACIMAPHLRGKPIAAEDEHIPTFSFPEIPARVLSKLANYADWRNQPIGLIPEFDDIDPQLARSICRESLRAHGPGWLSVFEVRQVLNGLSIPIAPGGFARTADEAAKLGHEIGFPVVLKLASRAIVHKTEFGGVKLNLTNESAVREAFAEIQARLGREDKLMAMDGVIVQPMIHGGVELMVGVAQDPSFGPLIAFGLGGIHVEILKDVSFRVTPITDVDAAEMVRSIRGYRLLQGYRGHAAADIPSIQEFLLRVSRLVEEIPEIQELDLNPVIAFPPGRGCLVLDARISVKPEKNR